MKIYNQNNFEKGIADFKKASKENEIKAIISFFNEQNFCIKNLYQEAKRFNEEINKYSFINKKNISEAIIKLIEAERLMINALDKAIGGIKKDDFNI